MVNWYLDGVIQLSRSKNDLQDKALKQIKLRQSQCKQRQVIEAQIATHKHIRRIENSNRKNIDSVIITTAQQQQKEYELKLQQKRLQKQKLYEILKMNYDRFKESKRTKRKNELEEGRKYLMEYDKVLEQREKRTLMEVQARQGCRTSAINSNKTTIIAAAQIDDPVTPSYLPLQYSLSRERSTEYQNKADVVLNPLYNSLSKNHSTSPNLQSKRKSIEQFRSVLDSQIKEKSLFRQHEDEKNQWFFNRAIQDEKQVLDKEKARIEQHRRKEEENFKFIRLQIEEKQRLVRKRNGKQRIKVKIEDDYGTTKKIRNR